VIVNNSTNINKVNNYLSPQIIDGHDITEILLKLALNTLTLTLIKPLNTKKTMTYDIGNPGRGLGQAHRCGGIKLFACCFLCIFSGSVVDRAFESRSGQTKDCNWYLLLLR